MLEDSGEQGSGPVIVQDDFLQQIDQAINEAESSRQAAAGKLRSEMEASIAHAKGCAERLTKLGFPVELPAVMPVRQQQPQPQPQRQGRGGRRGQSKTDMVAGIVRSAGKIKAEEVTERAKAMGLNATDTSSALQALRRRRPPQAKLILPKGKSRGGTYEWIGDQVQAGSFEIAKPGKKKAAKKAGKKKSGKKKA